jgi:hypothetical protein
MKASLINGWSLTTGQDHLWDEDLRRAWKGGLISIQLLIFVMMCQCIIHDMAFFDQEMLRNRTINEIHIPADMTRATRENGTRS